jgi:protein-disulfide isomerase
MKPIYLLAAAAAIFASAACDAKKTSDGAANATVVAKPVKPPANGDWSQLVSTTPAGGFLMGNPNAKLKLVEYGSMTCPHCREFDEKGVPALIAKYVRPGRVSYEFRNFVRDPYDLTAALIARCNGVKSFFPLTRALYKDQPNWVGKLQTVQPQQLEALQNLGPDRQFVEIAKLAGFQQWGAMRGVPTARSTACLRNEGDVNRLVQMNSDATSQYDVPGTPAFIVNGKLAEGATWEALEPQLRSALGG